MILLLAVGIIFLWAHLYLEPYDNRAYFLLDRLELNMLWSYVITLTGGLCLHEEIVGTSNKQKIEYEAIKGIVLLSHLRFIGILAYFVMRETVGKMFCPLAIANHSIRFDPITGEFNLARLRSHERK